jgi:hypothetical protein
VAHVLVAVLGLGTITAIGLGAAVSRRGGLRWPEAASWFRPLLRCSVASLGAMLVSGLLLDVLARGAFHGLWWFRGSVILLLATGALHGQARRALRLGAGSDERPGPWMARIEYSAYGMCVLSGAITVLMEVKPF